MTIAALRGRKPRGYSEVGSVLHELGIINREQAGLLKAMAGLRNILVHMYAHADEEKVLEASRRVRVCIFLVRFSMLVRSFPHFGWGGLSGFILHPTLIQAGPKPAHTPI